MIALNCGSNVFDFMPADDPGDLVLFLWGGQDLPMGDCSLLNPTHVNQVVNMAKPVNIRRADNDSNFVDVLRGMCHARFIPIWRAVGGQVFSDNSIGSQQ